jgi:hypothetical protein
MKQRRVVALSLCALTIALVGSAPRATAGVILFASEAAFDLAAPGIAIQTFAASTIAPSGVASMSNPLDSTTNNGLFVPGDILPGLAITATGNNPGSDLAVAGVGFAGNTNNSVFANFFVETLNILLSPGVDAVGLGMLSEFGVSDFDVSVFGPGDVLIGSTTVLGVPNSGAGLFLGMIATGGDSITRVNLSSQTGEAEGIDLVKFGNAGRAVPEPSSVTLFGLGLAGLAVAVRRRRRAA